MEKELEETRSESISLKLTHEEYRKLLKAKVSAITELKREIESIKGQQLLKVKELEYGLA